MENQNHHKPYKACPECDGMGIKVGPIDEATGQRLIGECHRCDGGGALILQGLREGEPIYRAPKLH